VSSNETLWSPADWIMPRFPTGVDQSLLHGSIPIQVLDDDDPPRAGMSWDRSSHCRPRNVPDAPNSLAALCAILADAGARRIVVVENLYGIDP